MMESVGAFAARGEPDTSALGTAWPRWPHLLVFDAEASKTNIHAAKR
jgi:para-nitrobenzyl esterase